ncbi:MAG: zinc ribbon domain-containing protein [Acidobacteria bacterium]|jgi:putative FmdB family regulatory protein|nr:zinc ribbon domain-containing protein [Acidobacteriota bacterium]
MPIYEYRCNQCGKTSEILVKNINAGVVCPTCASPDLVKLISEPGAVMAKGSSSSSNDAAPVCPNRHRCGVPGCPH